ncbi:hypothetical protein SAMN04487771_101129 [[Clostridium] aminophilum]|uniref:Uncharacterized protein n=1 Tax=[Clostridium] aminophilum TaxID=1526 RepID=A0A1I0DAS9_9FIRM|nr:DUF5640 domain-containing protein [[Clostridium] aminophilum]SET29388.1 hypothetical protein SAMN04487771_101129 [[Clostridium] aminophilum]
MKRKTTKNIKIMALAGLLAASAAWSVHADEIPAKTYADEGSAGASGQNGKLCGENGSPESPDLSSEEYFQKKTASASEGGESEEKTNPANNSGENSETEPSGEGGSGAEETGSGENSDGSAAGDSDQSDAGKNGDDQEQTGEGAEQSGDDQKKAGEDAEQSGDDQKKAGEDAEQSADDQEKAGEDAEQSADDQEKAGEDAEQSGDDQEKAGEDAEQSGDDQEKVGDDAEQSAENPEAETGAVNDRNGAETAPTEAAGVPTGTLPETLPVPEVVPAQSLIPPVQKPEIVEPEFLRMKDIQGTWCIDDDTLYRFSTNGTGALILPEHSYSFHYTLEEDILEMDFDKSGLRDSTFSVSLEDGELTMICLDEFFEDEFVLERAGAGM